MLNKAKRETFAKIAKIVSLEDGVSSIALTRLLDLATIVNVILS